MNLTVAIYAAILFFVLSPNVLLRLPANGSKLMVAGVHAIVFAVVLYFTQKWVWKMSIGLEGMEEGRGAAVAAASRGSHSSSKKKK
jgi:hypothetical protein